MDPFPYNVTAYLFRLFSGLSVLWSLRMVWPQQKRLATLAALFYLIYPGFLSQPNAIDFQSHIAGLCFATFSIALSLKAVTTKNLWPRISHNWIIHLLWIGISESDGILRGI